MRRRNVLSGPYLDRNAPLRTDPEGLARALADPSSRWVPLCANRNLVTATDPMRALTLPLADLPAAGLDPQELVLLGRRGPVALFAGEGAETVVSVIAPGARLEDLRGLVAMLPQEDAGLLAYARALLTWRHRHRFCGICGSPTAAARAGQVRVCSNSNCRHEAFPRLDPAVIVLVSDGDQVLLGRQASWPAGRYSTIAGFVEPGESLEDAVEREVQEETGVKVDRIEYHSSQPWPFPSSLMVGFKARALGREIERRDLELEDARWFSRAQIAAGTPLLPLRQSISFRLIEDWFDSDSERALAEILAARA
jgi:NAD+ diphosphatase